MRYFYDGGVVLARVDVDDDAALEVFVAAAGGWWQPRADKWVRAGNGEVQAEVLGGSSYLERIPAGRVAQVQAEIRGKLAA